MRTQGMTLHTLPLFVWAIFVTAILLLLALPVLAGRFIYSKAKNFTKPVYLTLNKQPKSITFDDIPSELKDIIIGLTLGDLYIRRRNKNTSLHFKQSLIHGDYILHLYTLFQEYCNMAPKIKDAVLKGKTHQSIYFDTLTYEAFNIFHELFYKDKKKLVPSNIQELLTARSIAYWAMDDGNPDRSGFIFNTHSFSLEEVELLVKALKFKFDLNCSIHTRTNNSHKSHLIYVKAESWEHFKSLIEPYVIPHFSYKLRLR